MKKIFLFILFVSTAYFVNAQARFFDKFKIEYERTVNVHAQYKDMDNSWFEQIKERIPKEVKTYHEFIGDATRTIYRPGKEAPFDARSWYRPVADKNVVYTDFQQAKTVSQKPVFEETF
jgi:hypothetical protein